MNKPSLLLFDLGGVIIESATFDHLNSLLPIALDAIDIKQRWLFSPAVRSFELGQISPQQFAIDFIEEWQLALTPEEFLLAFMSWPRDYYPEAKATLQELRQNYRLACLSNTNEMHWQKFAGFGDLFDLTFFSHLIGLIKPDPAAFLMAIQESNVPADQIYYFDDLPANIQAAQSLGMQAFLVDGFDSVQSVLISKGILVV